MRQFLAIAVIFAATCAAQEFRATISGRVTDSQSAVITGVKVIAVEVATGAKFETVTDSDGLYTIPFLPPAAYRISAEAPGFKHYIRDNVAAGANERLGIDIQMEIGAVTETLNVTAEAPILQTTTASTGQVITATQIETCLFPAARRWRSRSLPSA